MSPAMRYISLLMFVLVIFAIAVMLGDGIPIGRGSGGGPIIEP